MKSQKKSKAFTLIEVLISIIIVGIVMATIPILMTAFTTSLKTNVKEEVFFSQFSLLNLISAKYFDENNTQSDNYYKVLSAPNGDGNLSVIQYSPTEYNRKGKHQYSQGSRPFSAIVFRSGSNYSVTSSLGPEPDEVNETMYDDVDDYNGYVEHHSGIVSGGYDLNVSVKYVKDNANYADVNITYNSDYTTNVTLTNIKLITITTNVNGVTIKLTYPICNIGRAAMLSYK